MEKQKRKNDILLIAVLLVLCVTVWGILQFSKKEGANAEVTIDGRVVEVLPLNRDAEICVNDDSGGANTVRVEKGLVFVTEANCPDHLCVRQGKIRYQGESIVCLPHKLVVTICGGDEVADAFSN